MFRWIPNALTVSRCVFGGLVLLALWRANAVLPADEAGAILQQLWFQFALLAFLSGVLTDWIDGWAARALKAESRFGTWLDPIADKLLVAAALVGLVLTFGSWLITLPAAAIIGRDIFITWLRATPRGKDAVMPSQLAKWKTGLEMVAIIFLMLPMALISPPTGTDVNDVNADWAWIATGFVIGLLWAAAALSWLTAWRYIKLTQKT